jgi:transposase
MPKTYQLTEENKKEIEEQMKKTKKVSVYKKLEVLLLRAQGKKGTEIAEKTGYSPSHISVLISEYANNGIGYFQEEHRKGGNHRNMSKEEEQEFLEGFRKQAEAGQILNVGEIKKKYYETIGKPANSNSVIYNLLRRNGWRKIMPRSQHPKKASAEVIEASKKLTKCTQR